MVDVNTFLAVFYVMIDDFGKISLPVGLHQDPHAALSRSERLSGNYGLINQRVRNC